MVFRCEELGIDYPVFTTRPDTLFGATFFVLAPEHPDVLRLNDSPEVHDYVNRALTESAEERGDEHRKKTACRSAAPSRTRRTARRSRCSSPTTCCWSTARARSWACRPTTSATSSSPTEFGLQIRRVIECGELPCTDDGPMVNSGRFDGLHNREAYEQIVDWLESEGKGKRAVNYRLRDWLLSRQRYWGCPIPMRLLRAGRARARCPTTSCRWSCRTWRTTRRRASRRSPPPRTGSTRPARSCGGPARRETDTMDTFVDSSWYFLRYCDPHNARRRGTARSWTAGCRWTSTSAASSTRSCT